MDLSLNNIVNISVATPPTGVGAFNTSNLLIVTGETPEASFGTDGYKIYLSPTQVSTDFGSTSRTYQQALSVFSQQLNILAGGGYLVIATKSSNSEKLGDSITRLSSVVQFFGVISSDDTVSESDAKAAATVVQALDNKMLFLVSKSSADLADAAVFDDIKDANETKTRCLYYGGVTEDENAHLKFLAGYASKALSTNFSGVNTTQTLHLKDVAGVTGDSTITENLKNMANLAGVDIYANIAGTPKILTSGANEFFDYVYNLEWFKGSLQVSLFNALAQTSTKVPQTDEGMAYLKNVARRICEAAVDNGFVAPGSWTLPDFFGNQEDFLLHLGQRGYYIYSLPVARQSATAREARQAPLIQVAIKSAGAIHSSNIIININK